VDKLHSVTDISASQAQVGILGEAQSNIEFEQVFVRLSVKGASSPSLDPQ